MNSNIGKVDYELLKKMYKNNWDYVVDKLNNNYPIQYLIGYVDFYGTKINVNEDVLIPRFETELLVEKSIDILKVSNYKSILDVCTGSGCIAILLSKHLGMKVDACDISDKALDMARNNALENNTLINFFKLDILREKIKNKYDVIISNPPYVRIDEYTSPETKYEPSIALYASLDGLEFYEAIISKSKDCLNDKGLIIFELGSKQASSIKKIALRYYPKAKVVIEKDYNNYERFMFIYT